MTETGLRSAALVLLGHGTELNADSSASVLQHAAAIRQQGIFGEVREAFWKQEPQIQAVLGSISRDLIVIVPFFLSEGYFSGGVIPAELGFGQGSARAGARLLQDASRTLVYCKPLGTHPSLTRVVLHRALGVLSEFPFPVRAVAQQTTLFIAGHGTERNSKSRDTVEAQVQELRRLGTFAEVHGVFMEEDPRISSVTSMAKTRNIVVVPFFGSDGLHAREDIPVLLGEPAAEVKRRVVSGQPAWRNPTGVKSKLIWYSQAVGSDPALSDVIVEIAKEAAQAVPRGKAA